MATKRLTLAAVLLGAATLAACATSPLSRFTSYIARDAVPSTRESANTVLYLSNQTSDHGWGHVVLAVYVDDVLTVRRSMKSVFLEPNVAHGFPDEIPLHLAPGPHTIRVVAEGAAASAEAQVTVGDEPVHVDAAFFYGSDSLRRGSAPETSVTIIVTDERPGFC